jgi:hypothetical protein
MTLVLPGGNNTFVPTFEQKRSLIIDYARKPSSFAVNRYTQVVPNAPSVGYYLNLDIAAAARMSAGGQEFQWPDGARRPSGATGTAAHEFLPYITNRETFPFTLGQKGVEQASWDNVERHSRIQQQLAMTRRAVRAVAVATTSGNYAAAHRLDATSYSGDSTNWANSTVAKATIRKTVNAAVKQIFRSTLGAVKKKDLQIVIGPDLAAAIAESQEVIYFISESQHAKASLEGDLFNSNPNVDYDLPKYLFGLELVIEDTVRTTNKPGATFAQSFVLPGATPFICARPGGIEGKYGAPSFSTISCFAYEEMNVEAKSDSWERLTEGAVTEDLVYTMTAPSSGVLISNAM